MELFTAIGKLKNIWQLEIFDVCTTGDTANIHTILKFLPHTRQHGYIDILHCLYARIIAAVKNIDAPMLTRVWHEREYSIHVSPVVHTPNISRCQKSFFSFPVAVNNSIKVGPLVLLL
jgi:hypothetical protein